MICRVEKGGVLGWTSSDIFLGRDLFTALVLDLKFSENIIIGVEGPYEGCLVTMVDLISYDFKSLTENIVKPE